MSKQLSSTPAQLDELSTAKASHDYSSTLGTIMNTMKGTAPSNQTLVSTTNQGQRPTAMQKNVAPFLNKVYNMVNDPNSDDLIRWSADGKSFFVVRHEDFARSVLPRFFKHSNFSSFVRQLNMYGFHKVPHLQHGVLHSDSDSEQWEFSNPHFQRNQPDLLLLVTRKKGRENDEKEVSNNASGTTSSKGASTSSSTNIDLQHIMEEIQTIKQHQMNISSQLKNIQNDNSILWQETISARERHQRHQDTIDKILRFLASVFSNDKSMAIPRKRRYLLEAPDKKDQQDIEYQQDGNKNTSNERPTKVQKKETQPEFKLEDFVPGLQECNESTTTSSSQPRYNKSTNLTSELADAIALNDKSKQSSSVSSLRSPMQLPHDITQMMSPQQIQGLQSLISLAQSNPALLSQLTTDVFNTYHHSTTNTTSIPATTTAKSDYSQFIPPPSIYTPLSLTNPTRYSSNQRGIMPAAIQPRPTPEPVTSLDPLQNTTTTPFISPASSTTITPNEPPFSDSYLSMDSLTRTADDINSDIDTLGSNIEALAQQLGFDPTKTTDDLLGYVDMDKFLLAYGDANVVHDPIYSLDTVGQAGPVLPSAETTDKKE